MTIWSVFELGELDELRAECAALSHGGKRGLDRGGPHVRHRNVGSSSVRTRDFIDAHRAEDARGSDAGQSEVVSRQELERRSGVTLSRTVTRCVLISTTCVKRLTDRLHSRCCTVQGWIPASVRQWSLGELPSMAV